MSVKGKRGSDRFIRRLETEFRSGGNTYRGISSDLSESGLFIRTRKGLAPDSYVDIVLYLPDGTPCKMAGIVRRTIKTDSVLVKNGMGVQLVESDPRYRNFLRTLSGEITIISCTRCGVKNKIPTDKLSLGPKCGKCKSPLQGN